ncbi:hypothetical protein C7B65_18135 [Phormidesmis priestleyi ULC007]|uniref:Uncharacterized protein n=1 Tax=Phormidesmis priestleyi ULC007 TaxID=1920490 RepID=A0A2T1DAV7_9CYAN|nr:hypothetical protein [Phormidesmis priestleyi]PSB17606.1 hypothetical protein C7B65_18135 [Phormidesmis priestleyi ULC007]PZO48483.1 MAG: hypothetical protein DCF14_16835 [Phormidesmis priestleyi]
MTALSRPQYVPEDSFAWSQQTIASWRLSPQIQRIDYDSRHEMAQFQIQDGETTLAQTRIEHFAAIVLHRWPKAVILMVELFVLFLGMLAFNALPTQLAKLLGRQEWSEGIGLLVGAAFAWLIHNRAVRGLGKLRRRHDSRQALQMIQTLQKASAQNEFFRDFYRGQQSCLSRVEGGNLQGQFWLDLGVTIVVSLLEGAAIFYQVQQNPQSTEWAILSSVLPVALIWLAALLQSDRADFADSCAELISDYRDFLPDGTISQEQTLRLYELDAVFKHFTAAIPSEIKTVKGARANARSEFSQVRIEQLEAECIQDIEERNEKLRQVLQQLPNQFPMPQKFDVAGYRGFEIPSDQHNAWQNNTEQIAQEVVKLKAEAEEDYDLIRARICQQIRKWQRIKTEAEQTRSRAEKE